MKNKWLTFLMFFSMILTISCGKDYNALFKERVAELNKEGKYILNRLRCGSPWMAHQAC